MQRPLRVLVAIGSMSTGGAERQVLNLLKNFDRSRVTPLLYLLDRSGPFLAEMPDDVRVIAFSDVALKRQIYAPGRVFAQQVRHLRRVLREHAIDVLYDRTFLMPIITGLACRSADVPQVCVIAADPRADLQHNIHRFRWLKRQLLTRTYRQATRVISVATALGRTATEFYGLSEQQVLTVYNGWDFESLDKASMESGDFYLSEEFAITYLGRLVPMKAVDVLLRAFAPLVSRPFAREPHLWIVGDGPDRARLEQLTQQLGISARVHFTGMQSNPFPRLKHSQLCVLPSRSEGLPGVLIEAMICGVPVISTDCPFGPDEILEAGRLGRLIAVDDVAALTTELHAAVSGDESFQQRAVLARASARTRFSMIECARRTTEVLEDAVRQRR